MACSLARTGHVNPMKTAIAASLLALIALTTTAAASAPTAHDDGPCPPLEVMLYDPYVAVHPECIEPASWTPSLITTVPLS